MKFACPSENTAQPDCFRFRGREVTMVTTGDLYTRRQGWKMQFKDPLFRHRVVKSVWLCLCLFSYGLITAQRGPAMLDLQLITNSDVQKGSMFFTAASAGNVVCSLISGVMYDLINKSLLIIVSMLMMGLLTALTPFCSIYWLMVTVIFAVAGVGGSMGTVGNAEVVRIWAGEGDAVLQAIHFAFAVGGFMGPIITEPFLTSCPDHDNISHVRTHNDTDTDFSSALLNSLDKISVKNTQIHGIYYEINAFDRVNTSQNLTLISSTPETEIHIVFIISGSVAVLSALPLIVEYMRKKSVTNDHSLETANEKKTTSEEAEKDSERKESEALLKEKRVGKETEASLPAQKLKLPLWLYICALVWSCLVFMILVGIEESFPSFLTTYTVLQLKWSKSQGAILTSVYWISFAVSRGISIFIISFFNGIKHLSLCLILSVLSFLTLLLSSLWEWEIGVWVACVVAGAVLSAIFPGFYSLVGREVMYLSGRVTAALVMSAKIGAMINPLIIGYLMKEQGAIWLPYLLLVESVLGFMIFISLLLFTLFLSSEEVCYKLEPALLKLLEGSCQTTNFSAS